MPIRFLVLLVLAAGLASASAQPAAKETWWSFRALKRPDASATGNQVDHFILAKLRDKGLSLSPEADRRTLVRRVTFDLTGLPPTPEEVEAFVNDKDSQAYEKLVDRLLASSAYGERFARLWMD